MLKRIKDIKTFIDLNGAVTTRLEPFATPTDEQLIGHAAWALRREYYTTRNEEFSWRTWAPRMSAYMNAVGFNPNYDEPFGWVRGNTNRSVHGSFRDFVVMDRRSSGENESYYGYSIIKFGLANHRHSAGLGFSWMDMPDEEYDIERGRQLYGMNPEMTDSAKYQGSTPCRFRINSLVIMGKNNQRMCLVQHYNDGTVTAELDTETILTHQQAQALAYVYNLHADQRCDLNNGLSVPIRPVWDIAPRFMRGEEIA